MIEDYGRSIIAVAASIFQYRQQKKKHDIFVFKSN